MLKSGRESSTNVLNRENTHLDGDRGVVGNVGSSTGSQTRELEGVHVEEVSSFSRELDSTIAVGASSLDEEGVVVLDQLPDESRGHCCYVCCGG